MNQDISVIRVIGSIEKEVNNTLDFGQLQAIRKHLYLIYGVGYDEGRKHRNQQKIVIRMKNGIELQEYPSAKEAANIYKVNDRSVQKACRGITKTCRGFEWKYKEEKN